MMTKNVEACNMILKYLAARGIDYSLDVMLDESDPDNVCPQVQIDVKLEGLNFLAFFFNTTTDNVQYSAIFEMGPAPDVHGHYSEWEARFEKENTLEGASLIEDPVDEIVHIYNEVKQGELTLDILHEIIQYFVEPIPIVKMFIDLTKEYLNS